ncbi:MAG: ATP-dependent zinc metalloprotease FtsH [Acidisphaera sp.]|nr:ATP-dependent zinc metalloprotease FtsH [Acidisphaera sp.]MBV9811816.1 ATP-dependent zinc metalloprotease FtsH [Acetobacteraceae bacterium]
MRWFTGHPQRRGLQRPQGQKPPPQEVRAHFWYWIVAFGVLMLFQSWWVRHQTVEAVPYSQFLTLLQDHKIKSVQVENQYLLAELNDKLPSGRSYVSTTAVPAYIENTLKASGTTYTGVVPSTFWSTLLSWLVPLAIFGFFWTFVFRRMAQRFGGEGGLMSIGKSRAKIFVETDTKTTFADVAGADEAKDELDEIVQFLKDPKGYGRLGAHVPKGVLLVGPPGTGKTLLARAVAGEAGVPYFSISGSEFVEMFVGVGAARVRDLFQQAAQRAPAIVFIDELDALGRARGAYGGIGGHDEKEQTLNQLLVELDGFDPRTGIVLLAATNRPEVLDPALLRAGRFDRQVLVDRPDRAARRAILALHLKKIRMAANVDVDRIAELTPGLTGADLANVVNEAALLATRRKAGEVEMDDVNEAIERSVAGLARRSRVLQPKEREIVAFHEMGHALVAVALPGADPVHKVSIIPRGVGALGYTIQRPTEDRYLMTREELEQRMAVLLGGRAAEMLVFDSVTTGAADDLQRATDMARAMVARFGMVESFGPAAFEKDRRSFLGGPEPMLPDGRPEMSEATAQAIDELVRGIVRHALDQALEVLRERRDLLERTARRLLEKETLSAEEITQMADERTPEPV